MRRSISVGATAAVLVTLLLVPSIAVAKTQTVPLVVQPLDYDFGLCPGGFADVAGGLFEYQAHYELSNRNEVVGYADVCHVVVSGSFDMSREEIILGRWHLDNDADYVETTMEGRFVDEDNGLGQGWFDGEVVGGTGRYEGSAGVIRGHAIFNPQDTSNAGFNFHLVMGIR